jgi:PhnO protein
MVLRNATLSDLHRIYELICELEQNEMPFQQFEQIYSHNINDENVHYIVAGDNEQLVAFGSVHIQRLLHHSERAAEIHELVVRDCYRGQGIGRRLINKLIEISQQNECELIEVCCNRKRVDTHKFYEQCGLNKSHYKFTLRWK